MLIVIVIIGILIAALLPRMSAAQWRARDVSRKTALSQIQSAIVTYQWDYGSWPMQDSLSEWTGLMTIESELLKAWMSSVPGDPLNWVTFSWVVSNGSTVSDYGYVIAKRNWVQSWWFALMAKTEVAWSANWVVCGNADLLTGGRDLVKDTHLCSKVMEGIACSNPNVDGESNICTWTLEQMRYIVIY